MGTSSRKSGTTHIDAFEPVQGTKLRHDSCHGILRLVEFQHPDVLCDTLVRAHDLFSSTDSRANAA